MSAAGLAATPLARAAARGYQIGCWTRPWAKNDYPTAFNGIAEAGYKYIGLMNITMNGKPALTADSTAEGAGAIAKEVAKRGMKTISIWSPPFPFQKSVEAGVSGLKRIIDNAAVLGSPSLLLGGIGKPELMDPYYKVVSECCAYAASKRVVLSVKPHGGTNANGADCRNIVQRVGRKNFGIFYDPGNIFYYSDGKLDPVDDAATVNGLVVGMIIKDYRAPKEVMLTPGTGQVKFREVFAKLKKGGFKHGPLVVECLDPGDAAQTIGQARKARLFVEGMLKG